MRSAWFALRFGALLFGFAFLYAPILLLVLYSFNESRNVTVWAGFSTRWYRGLLDNQALLDATLVSVGLGLAAATCATALGVFAALALARPGRFHGGRLLAVMTYGPLVMPEIIMGLSVLLLLIALGVERGLGTLFLAHVTFTTCFATVVIRSRLVGFDAALEDAAADLGAPPARTFLTVTLPIIMPAVAAAWIIAFAISFDDLIISQFTTGPGAQTLPMLVYGEARRGVKPEINAISTVLIVAVGLLVVLAAIIRRFGARSSRSGFAA